MQGHTQSSLAIWTVFNNYTTAFTRFLRWQLRISWKRVTGTNGFAIVGTSMVAGTDLVQGSDSVFTPSDAFTFYDETQRLVRFEFDRQLQEPLGGMAMALGDLVLDNTDGRFTPEKNGTIGTAILPNRPLLFYLGFLLGAVEKVIPMIKGLTRQPKEDKVRGTVAIPIIDYVQFLNEYALETTIYQGQRSDQIIEDILNTVGLGTSQYELDEGVNTIGFAWFQKGQTAGERIKRICEAEEAVFYQDEAGILRFENRRHFSASPHNISVWDIDPDDIVTWEGGESTRIINKAIVRAKPRTVQSATEIWRAGGEEEVKRGETKVIWAQFNDPVTALEAIAQTTDYIAMDETNGAGTDRSSLVTIIVTLFTTTAKLEISHTHNSSLYFPFLRLRGTPAIITEDIAESFEDTTSINRYNRQQVEIENDFIDTRDFAYYMARALVRKYRVPTRRIILTVQGIPQLQLRDKVRVKDIDLGTYKNYRVMRIQGLLDGGLFTQKLTLREIVVGEADQWAIVGSTVVEAPNEFVGA